MKKHLSFFFFSSVALSQSCDRNSFYLHCPIVHSTDKALWKESYTWNDSYFSSGALNTKDRAIVKFADCSSLLVILYRFAFRANPRCTR